MTLADITAAANAATAESISSATVRYYVNEAISKINIELRATLPLFAVGSTVDYSLYLGESWINSLLIPYACYSIKLNDDSLNEANMFKMVFLQNLDKINQERNSAIADTYRATNFSRIYRSSGRNGVNTGWFGTGTVTLVPTKSYASFSLFPVVGSTSYYYYDMSTGLTYVWIGVPTNAYQVYYVPDDEGF